MAFYPDVVPGTTFVPIASLENQVRRNINALNGIGGSAIKDKSLSTVRIRVYNNTELTLPAGTAVGFILSSALVGDAVPAEAVKDISKPWGVLADSLKPNDIGDCIISGPVTVDCTGTGAFALPDINTPDVFKLGSTGAPVLFSADGRAMINLGASSGGSTEYNGYFAVVDDSDLSGETPIYRVKVIDSASENEYSTYYFDYKPFDVDDISLVITGSCSIVLHVTTPVDTSSNPTAEIVALETVPASDEDDIYYVLADVVLAAGSMTITQRHNGNAMIFWLGDCN